MVGPARVSKEPAELEKSVAPSEAAAETVGAGPELVQVDGSKLVRIDEDGPTGIFWLFTLAVPGGPLSQLELLVAAEPEPWTYTVINKGAISFMSDGDL